MNNSNNTTQSTSSGIDRTNIPPTPLHETQDSVNTSKVPKAKK